MNKESRRESLIPTRNRTTTSKRQSLRPLGVRSQQDENILYSVDSTSKISRSVKSPMFQITTTENAKTRNVPEELQGKPSIIGNEQKILCLYQYTQNIAHAFFSLPYYKKLFPDQFKGPSDYSRLSFMSKNSFKSTKSTKSHIPIMNRKKSFPFDPDPLDEVPPSEIDFKPAFKLLEKGLNENQKKMLELTDFCLLYPSLILSVNLNSSNVILEFLDKFLDLKSTKTHESNILFAVLIGIYDKVYKKDTIISVLGKLAKLEESIRNRLINGTTHQTLSPLCIKVLNSVDIDYQNDNTQSSDMKSAEAEAIQILSEFLESLASGGQPSDFSDFLLSIACVMERFENSAMVLEHAATCAESILKYYTEPSIEVLHKFILICSKILSKDFTLEGENSVDANESIQALYFGIFKNIPVTYLERVVSSAIAEANGTILDVIITKLQEIYTKNLIHFDDCFYKTNIDMLKIFHPEYQIPECFTVFTKDQIQKYQESLERLSNPETLADEVEKIVSLSEDGDFSNYPNEYITMLRTSWIIKTHKQPVNCNSWQYEKTINLLSTLTKTED